MNRRARDVQMPPPVVTAPPPANPMPLPEKHRTAGLPCPTCGGPGERFSPGVHHCTDPACGTFWSPS